MISFLVPGIPRPKGSLRAFATKGGRVGVKENNADMVQPWMGTIAVAALKAGAEIVDGPVRVGLTFIFPRPKFHYNKAGGLKINAPFHHTKKPDLDKLVRAVLDALTGVAFVDDSQVVSLAPAKKRYLIEEGLKEACGVWVEIEEVT